MPKSTDSKELKDKKVSKVYLDKRENPVETDHQGRLVLEDYPEAQALRVLSDPKGSEGHKEILERLDELEEWANGDQLEMLANLEERVMSARREIQDLKENVVDVAELVRKVTQVLAGTLGKMADLTNLGSLQSATQQGGGTSGHKKQETPST